MGKGRLAGKWHTSLIPALRRQGNAELSESEFSLVYIVSLRTAKAVYYSLL